MKLQLVLLVFVSSLLAGCGGPAAPPAPTPPPETPIATMDFESGGTDEADVTTEGEAAEPEETNATDSAPKADQ